jgi:hypothetical protein
LPVIVKGTLFDVPFRVAVTTTTSSFKVAVVLALALPDVEPEGTVTEPGRRRLAELPERATLTPPLGAAALKRTEQVTVPVAGTLVGLHCTDVSVGTPEAVRVIIAVLEIPP